MVAGECALKSAVSKMKGKRCGIGSLGKRKVVRRRFASSSPERRRANDSSARCDGARSGGATAWFQEVGEDPTGLVWAETMDLG
jgi:hypothetical protein